MIQRVEQMLPVRIVRFAAQIYHKIESNELDSIERLSLVSECDKLEREQESM